MYTSDHGNNACEHGIMEKAPGICTDAITRIPAIGRWKGHFKEGHVAQAIVETVDVSTTLGGLTGINSMPTSDGKDISPLLAGELKEVYRMGATEFLRSKSVPKVITVMCIIRGICLQTSILKDLGSFIF